MLITARIKERFTGQRDEPDRRSDQLQVDAPTYDDGQRQVLDQLPDGWIVASWRVEPDHTTREQSPA